MMKIYWVQNTLAGTPQLPRRSLIFPALGSVRQRASLSENAPSRELLSAARCANSAADVRNPDPLKPSGFIGSHRDRLVVLQPFRLAQLTTAAGERPRRLTTPPGP